MEELMEILRDNECALVTGYDECIVTHTAGPNVQAVYSTGRIIRQLMREGLTETDAWDHFYYNIVGSVPGGDNAPVFIYAEE